MSAECGDSKLSPYSLFLSCSLLQNLHNAGPAVNQELHILQLVRLHPGSDSTVKLSSSFILQSTVASEYFFVTEEEIFVEHCILKADKNYVFIAITYVNMLGCFIMCKNHYSQLEQHNHALRLQKTKSHLLLLQSGILFRLF